MSRLFFCSNANLIPWVVFSYAAVMAAPKNKLDLWVFKRSAFFQSSKNISSPCVIHSLRLKTNEIIKNSTFICKLFMHRNFSFWNYDWFLLFQGLQLVKKASKVHISLDSSLRKFNICIRVLLKYQSIRNKSSTYCILLLIFFEKWVIKNFQRWLWQWCTFYFYGLVCGIYSSYYSQNNGFII